MKPSSGLAVHHIESLKGRSFLALRSITPAEMEKVVSLFYEVERVRIATVLGVNADGLFGSEDYNWMPDMPAAYSKPFVFLPWAQILELLGRVPEGTLGVLLSNEPQTKQ